VPVGDDARSLVEQSRRVFDRAVVDCCVRIKEAIGRMLVRDPAYSRVKIWLKSECFYDERVPTESFQRAVVERMARDGFRAEPVVRRILGVFGGRVEAYWFSGWDDPPPSVPEEGPYR